MITSTKETQMIVTVEMFKARVREILTHHDSGLTMDQECSDAVLVASVEFNRIAKLDALAVPK